MLFHHASGHLLGLTRRDGLTLRLWEAEALDRLALEADELSRAMGTLEAELEELAE